MKRLAAVALSALLALGTSCAAPGKPPAGGNGGELRRVAYFTSWSAYDRGLQISDIDASLLTHINFAFANLGADGTVRVGDEWADTEKPFSGDSWLSPAGSRGLFGQLRKLKRENPHLKTLLSVGGWSWSGNFSDAAATARTRETFANSALRLIREYGFDGLDIDWEFPVAGGDNIRHRKEDRKNYTLLLQKTRAVFDAQGKKDGGRYLLTIAAGPGESFLENTELLKMEKCLDFINLMTYDYQGGWDGTTGHNAPLYCSGGPCVDHTVKSYLHAGIKAAKLNLGLAFYGRGWGNVSGGEHGMGAPGTPLSGKGLGRGTWEGGSFEYWDLAQNYVNKNGFVRYYDEKAQAPVLYNGSVLISYDDEVSIAAKVDYAVQRGLGGVMFWEFAGDKEKVLQRVAAERIAARPQPGCCGQPAFFSPVREKRKEPF